MTTSLQLIAFSIATGIALRQAVGQQSASPLGRWLGESHCVGEHPTCHDEHVVYRISSAGSRQITLDGSRITGGDTVDMGALSCESSGAEPHISCRIPNGTWLFSVVDGHLEGVLTLTDNSVVRRVVAYRAPPN